MPWICSNLFAFWPLKQISSQSEMMKWTRSMYFWIALLFAFHVDSLRGQHVEMFDLLRPYDLATSQGYKKKIFGKNK